MRCAVTARKPKRRWYPVDGISELGQHAERSRSETPAPKGDRLPFVGVFDVEQPEDIFCQDCVVPIPWTRWEPNRPNVAARWMPPTPDEEGAIRCIGCKTHSERTEADRRAIKLQRKAGVPPIHLGYRWKRFVQPGPEDAGDSTLPKRAQKADAHTKFLRRVKSMRLRTLGLTESNLAVARACAGWKPYRGRWLFVEGNTGAGKSLFSACLTRSLVLDPLRFEEVPEEELTGRWARASSRGQLVRPPMRPVGGYAEGVMYAPEVALQTAQQQHWRKKRDYDSIPPLEAAKSARVLILDDLGSGDLSKESWMKAVAGLIDARYRDQLPTVITSNVPWADLLAQYQSKRMVSRLADVCDRYVLDTVDWRTVQ